MLGKLEAKVPASMPEERSRLFMNYLVTKVGELGKNQKLEKTSIPQYVSSFGQSDEEEINGLKFEVSIHPWKMDNWKVTISKI